VLLELRVENLLLIERAQLAFAPGLNVLTGETGAGKTVLAHALDLLLGGRARTGIVRPGCAEAYVEGVFSLPPDLDGELGERLPADLEGGAVGRRPASRAPLPSETEGGAVGRRPASRAPLPSETEGGAKELVLARRVGADGRTRAYVNGRSAAVGDLRELGERLLAFYGQHEHRKLTLAAAQLEILDEFCGAEQARRLRECRAAYEQTRALERELHELRELAAARERELDLLDFELGEIEAAAPQQGEHERLCAARERLRRMDALCGAVGQSAEALVPESPEMGGAAQAMAAALARLDGVAGVDPDLDGLGERARALVIEAQDLATELRRYGERLGAQDGALEEVEERLQTLERLMRKHGGTLDGVLEHAVSARARREQLQGAAVALEQATARLREAQGVLDRHVHDLREARRAGAPRLADAVRGELAALAMEQASFEVRLSEREAGAVGGDLVEFVIAPNPGVAAGPLREIASGGELSRVMLALTTACDRELPAAGAGSQTTLVFDEVDAGIGGHTARAVGERLRGLGEGRQVICITHLPQIASLGARHFSIVKDTDADPTRTCVVELGEREVVSELVRMLGAAEDDVSARRHARELRKAA
jgi:DNA repair protein RecN (Recombination protein N)